MKICFITYSIFDLGGIQRVTSVIANELSKEHKVDIICTCGKYKVDRSLYNLSKNINVQINEDLKRKNKMVQVLYKCIKEVNKVTSIFNREGMQDILTELYYPKKVRKRFINYLNDKEYDVVIGVAGEYSLLLGAIANDINAKTIGWQHNSFDAYLNTKGRYFWNQNKLFEKYIPKLDNYIVLNNNDRSKFLENMGINSTVIYNPKSFKSEVKSKVDKKRFLAAGRFNYQKGFDLLIESFKEFSREESNWKLTIVGEGEEKDKIKSMIKKYNLEDKVSIEPFTDNIKEYFLNSSVLLLSSRWEGMPMIVLEALEMGVPTIAYNISAIEPLIDNYKEGIIVDKYDTIQFSNAMKEISQNNKLRRDMSINSYKKSEVFGIDSIMNKWYEVLNN